MGSVEPCIEAHEIFRCPGPGSSRTANTILSASPKTQIHSTTSPVFLCPSIDKADFSAAKSQSKQVVQVRTGGFNSPAALDFREEAGCNPETREGEGPGHSMMVLLP